MEHGKRAILKDQTLITTAAILEQVEACEEATKKKKNSKGRKKRTSGLQAALHSVKDAQRQEEVQAIVMLDEIEVLIA